MTDLYRDDVTGKETTGHEWDGIRELNTPLPKWWLMVLYACIVWSIGYWVVYPAWPSLTNYTKGVINYNSRAEFAQEMTAATAAQGQWLTAIADSPVEAIEGDPELLNFAMAGGRATFNENCAPCHAVGGAGRPGFPVLADDDWIWGGTLADISQTLQHGIRNVDDAETRVTDMPRFGADEILDRDQINSVTEFVLSLSGRATDPVVAESGRQIFTDNCAACHGPAGLGLREFGAPNLADEIWLYGGEKPQLLAQIHDPKMGVMPAWSGRLDAAKIKMLAVYVHSLGGGE
ncbi:cytochrome-c oxidase, cbb3-type subunit III [Dongia sp.]|uniref:cytochrome-c oxidase, cbb3-type subunit III n=1 Tax=Dongia sp. TaxID=1977262 RepID=UPI0035B0D45F